MAMWGVGVMVGPILGPSLGGWLTEYCNWRRVFYINLPFGLLAWFASPEVVAEVLLGSLAFYLFIFVVGVVLLATLALLPPFMQNLMGYPVVDVGFLMAPRGVGTMIAMMAVGRLSGWVDKRYMISLGLILTGLSLWEMTHFNTDIDGWDVVRTGITQGLGLGFLFVPLSTISFATLAPRYRNEGTVLFSLTRNIGSSIGISVVMTYLARCAQGNHAAFAGYINPSNLALRQAVEAGAYNLTTPEGLVGLNAEVSRQATTLAYLQDFRLMMWVTLATLPLILLLRAPVRQTAASVVHAAMD